MTMTLEGSCRCGKVRFSVESHAPHPYQLCYCSICRKADGGGGFAINLSAVTDTLKIEGKSHIGMFRAEIERENGACETGTGERNFCTGCGTALWLYDPNWPELIHPFASCIDTPLPKPPAKTHLMLKYKPDWVVPDLGKDDLTFEIYPKESIEDWHKRHGAWVDQARINTLLPILLLVCSNVFMTTTRYWRLKFEDKPLWLVIAISWGIALFEYCLAAPANRWGSKVYSPAELKTIQEVVTLAVFAVFATVYLGQKMNLNHLVGFACIGLGALFIFKGPIPVR